MSKNMLAGLIVAVILLILAFTLFKAQSTQTVQTVYIKTVVQGKLIPFNKSTGIGSDCRMFGSVGEAVSTYSFPEELTPCKGEDGRWIGFYEGNDGYAFLTCKKLAEGNYYCCIMVSEKPTGDYNAWKEICS